MPRGIYPKPENDWRSLPWVCPKCENTLRASGKGAHSRWCGKSVDIFWARLRTLRPPLPPMSYVMLFSY